MSNSIGIIGGYIMGGHVGGNAAQLSGGIKFFPPHISRTSGKKVPMKAEFTAYINSLKGVNQKTGQPGRVDKFKVSVVGKRALTVCRWCGVGKSFGGTFELQSYEGVYYQPNGQPIVLPDGTKAKVQKTMLVMEEFVLGDDAPNAIALEIQNGIRPANWNVTGHPDVQLWTQMIAQRKRMVWDGRSQFFGFATVFPVDGQILPIVDEETVAPIQPVQSMTAFAGNNAVQVAANNGFTPYPNAPVQNGFCAPVAPVAPAPVAQANGFGSMRF